MNDAKTYTDPYKVDYFYGRILREDAEEILCRREIREGLFLLRESVYEAGNFVVSIINKSKTIDHFMIDRLDNGNVRILNNKEFIGPVELIEYNKKKLSGLRTKPNYPCVRKFFEQVFNFNLIDTDAFNKLVVNEMRKLGENPTTVQASYYKYQRFVLENLHLNQPWFLKNIDRDDAERFLRQPDYCNGRFLIRNSLVDDCFVISLCYNRPTVFHYIIKITRKGSFKKYHVDDGKIFGSIFELVDCYSRCNNDGLEGILQYPYPTMSSNIEDLPPYSVYIMNNQISTSQNVPISVNAHANNNLGFDPSDNSNEEEEDIYNVKLKNLEKRELLGSGCFGEVYKYVYKRNSEVAVKEIKIDNSKNPHVIKQQKEEILNEAKLINDLNCNHVIKCIGIQNDVNRCLILLEYAPLGCLKDYLNKHKSFLITKIVKICYQVATAMEYLAFRNIVHRDLAARNVLLFSEDLAKVSDFGLARQLEDSSYYIAGSNSSKVAYRWTAPEIFNFAPHKFEESSDVWSFGITFWEALSYGNDPFPFLKTPEDLLRLYENGYMLDKPEECDERFYNEIMKKCWNLDKDKRPKFFEIVKILKTLIYDVYQINVDLEVQRKMNEYV